MLSGVGGGVVCFHCSERHLCHVTEGLSSLTFALHFCFVPDGSGRAHASVSHSGGGGGAWEAATIKGMAWPASPVATGIRWGVSPAAQMGCLRTRSGSPSGADQP